MSEDIADRVWANPRFHENLKLLRMAWLQRELDVGAHEQIAESDMTRCAQAALILANSADIEKQHAAYSLAACAHGLGNTDLPGLAGVLRVVLTKMGNFPALSTAPDVANFVRLPMAAALSEAARRTANEVKVGDATLILTDFQRHLWDLLNRRSNVAISAPTSAGKSFILQNYLRNLARGGRLTVACYIVPSRALIGQVTDAISAWRLEEKLHDLSIINVPLPSDVELSTPAVYVVTQERMQAILGAHPAFKSDVVICDEAQNIQEGARGILLHSVVDTLIARSPGAQLIWAGPNMSNLSVFAQTFGLESLGEVRSRSPNVVQNLIVVNTRSKIKGELVLDRFSPKSREFIGRTNIGQYIPSIKERLVRISERFGQNKSSIVYANMPSVAEEVASGLTELSSTIEPSERLKDLADFVKLAVHKEYSLARCLQRRVGFHYGRIPALVRRAVESAFADGEIRYLVTTSTLIQGVNFPAANLFVCNPKKGQRTQLNTGEFWNLAGRAGRLGKEFQGNIFLIDYDSWETSLADESDAVEIRPFLQSTLTEKLDAIEQCALTQSPPAESDALADLEAVFTKLLSDHFAGKLERTLRRSGIGTAAQKRLTSALDIARARVALPTEVILASPTVSPIRQQRLADYLAAEIRGGGAPRLGELIPHHPRDEDAYKALSEIYRVCHEQILTLPFPKLHLRMAAISLMWMKGDPLPSIIDENHKRNGGKLSSNIRSTLQDIEEEIRFKYTRLTTCYITVLGCVLKQSGYDDYLKSLTPLPTYLEVGASDLTMISFISLGLSRLTARMLTNEVMNKDMDQRTALNWLRTQDPNDLTSSKIIQQDIRRALTNAGTG